jgi:branched-chain amino acid transport system substrate-binding protein
MMKKLWVLLLFCIFFLNVSLVLAAEKPPVKAIGAAVLSGKLGAIAESGWGLQDGEAFVNSHGGINGRKFQVLLEDVQYEVPIGVSVFHRVVAREPQDQLLFHLGWQTGVLHSLAEKAKETGVVFIDVSQATDIFNDKVREKYPNYFSLGVSYGDQCGVLLKYIKTNLYKGKSKPKVAFIYIDADAGRDPLDKMKMYAKEMGIELVLVEPVTFTETDYTATLMKIRQAKADYTILWSWSVPVTTRFVKMARKVIPDTTILGLFQMGWEIFFATAGADYDGIYMVSPYPRPSETKNKLVTEVLNMAKTQNRNIKVWDVYLQGFLMVQVAAEAARRADAAGDLSRKGVRNALENLKNWDLFGMYEGKSFDYSSHLFPYARILKANVQSKAMMPVTDWFVVKEYLK